MTAEEPGVYPLHHPSDILPVMRSFAEQAIRTIDIFSQQLVPVLYGDDEFVSLLSALARRGPQTKVRILVRDPRQLYGRDHPLVVLAQRLPSHIQLRTCLEDNPETQMGFFCVDATHLVHFLDEPNLGGYARHGARAESRQLLGEFEHLWTYGSKVDSNLSRLSL